MISPSSAFLEYVATSCLSLTDGDFLSRVISALEDFNPNISVKLIKHEYSPQSFRFESTDASSFKLQNQFNSAERNAFIKRETFYELNEFGVIPLIDFRERVNYLLLIPLSQLNSYKDLINHCTQIQEVYTIVSQDRAYQSVKYNDRYTRLMSQLSHDFNSMINLIPEECLKHETVKNKVDYIDKISREIISYLRELQLEKIQVSVKELFQSIIRGYDFPAKIDFTLDFSGGFDSIIVDVELIDRAMRAILENAIFAASIEGGKVTMNLVKRINQSPFVKYDWLQIHIEDSGPGIPVEFLSEVTKPFFTTWKDFSHPGLGLPMAEKIINAHEGELLIENKTDGGTKVSISLPLNDGNSKE